jgi:demethylmenaquinone methyltransferase/2-methoxy-6-polyprenyl-1,4-benzoquinol methylase
MAGPTNAASIAKYRRRAAAYDSTTHFTQPIRLRAIAHLALQPGDSVIDVGCGTGLSFEPILAAIGAQGRLIGIEQSPEMMQQARERVARQGWSNVTLIESAVEDATIGTQADALLFFYTHDILRTPEAVANLMAAATPGARVAVAGVKYYPWWLAPANFHVWVKNWLYNARPSGLRRPWDLLERYVALTVKSTMLGRGYLAHGKVRT